MSETRGRVGSPLQWIACDVIDHAATEWRSKPRGYKRCELVEFFQSTWFEELCMLVSSSVCPHAIRAELDIPLDEEIPQQLLLFQGEL